MGTSFFMLQKKKKKKQLGLKQLCHDLLECFVCVV